MFLPLAHFGPGDLFLTDDAFRQIINLTPMLLCVAHSIGGPSV